LEQIEGISSIQSIQIISGAATILTIVSLVTLIRPQKKSANNTRKDWKWQHFHLRSWIRNLLAVPSIFLLLLIYSLYDFAHGIYTPNLSILLTEQGISTLGVSLGYLAGDMIWGVSQIFSGRIIDKTGYYIPLIISLALKGITVVFYPEVTVLLALFVVIMLAGLAEGFLEPARNKAALSTEIRQKYDHSHVHLDVGFSSSGGLILGAHDHVHEHENKHDAFIGALQSVGIIFFGLGSLAGSWFISQGYFLADITIIGGVCLLFASLVGILFRVVQKRENHSMELDE
ncbi:MAG: MFS transporter, partial [Candidatus Hodarchaeales archaeon]